MSEDKISILIAKSDDFYYITPSHPFVNINETIAILIDMKEEDYKKLMQMRFNASEWHDITIFFNRDDAENALEYISSLILAKRLAC